MRFTDPSADPAGVLVDRAKLERRALWYLDRFDATEQKLRSVLRRFIDKTIPRESSEQRQAAYQLSDDLIRRYASSGLVDDERFAAAAVRGMRRRGDSSRKVVQRLLARGVPLEIAERVLAEASCDANGEAELEAARALVRRRRLGPFRPEPQRSERRQRDLAALGRAGFDRATALRALTEQDGDEPDR